MGEGLQTVQRHPKQQLQVVQQLLQEQRLLAAQRLQQQLA
jgi:hypothetical protein